MQPARTYYSRRRMKPLPLPSSKRIHRRAANAIPPPRPTTTACTWTMSPPCSLVGHPVADEGSNRACSPSIPAAWPRRTRPSPVLRGTGHGLRKSCPSELIPLSSDEGGQSRYQELLMLISPRRRVVLAFPVKIRGGSWEADQIIVAHPLMMMAVPAVLGPFPTQPLTMTQRRFRDSHLLHHGCKLVFSIAMVTLSACTDDYGGRTTNSVMGVVDGKKGVPTKEDGVATHRRNCAVGPPQRLYPGRFN